MPSNSQHLSVRIVLKHRLNSRLRGSIREQVFNDTEIPGLDLGLLSPEYVEQVYALYQADPARYLPSGKSFFARCKPGRAAVQPVQAATLGRCEAALRRSSRPRRGTAPARRHEPRADDAGNGNGATAPRRHGSAAVLRRRRAPRRQASSSRADQVPGAGTDVPASSRRATARRPVRRRSTAIARGNRTPKAACRKASTC